MSAVLPDTSVAIAALRGHAASAEALATADRVAISPVVEAELLTGAARAPTARDRGRVGEFLDGPRIERLVIARETAVRYAAIKGALRRDGTPVPTNDIWIAASAMEHGLRVLTLDRHFLEIRQILVEYFEAG